MNFSVAVEDGASIEFECADNLVSRWVNESILRGQTYPFLPFVDDVNVVLDVGANCGAASVHFGRHYPDAQVHAFEPAADSRGRLERNVARMPNVTVHPIGLYSVDQEMPLYYGNDDTGQASVIPRFVNSEEHEMVVLRSGSSWAAEHGIDRIDILKLDVEGVEIEVLESLVDYLPAVKILYVEYDSRAARRAIARLLEDTHELYAGMLFLDQGECVYLRRDFADDAATEHLRAILTAGDTAPA